MVGGKQYNFFLGAVVKIANGEDSANYIVREKGGLRIRHFYEFNAYKIPYFDFILN